MTKSPNRPTGPGKQSGTKPSANNSAPAKPSDAPAPVEATPFDADPRPNANAGSVSEAKPASAALSSSSSPSAPTAQPSPPVKRPVERGRPAHPAGNSERTAAAGGTGVATLIAAGLVGGLIAGAGFIAYDLTMRATPADQTARIAAIEERVERIAQRETAPPDALGDIESRLAAVEAQAGEALTTAQEAAGRTIPDVPLDAIRANTEAVSSFGDQLAALQNDVSAANSEMAAIRSAFTPAWRDAASQAVAASHVANAIAEGRPYPQAFQTLSALGVSGEYLAAIEPFAQQGAPGASDLVAGLRGSIGQARSEQAAAAPRAPDVGGGFLQRLAERAITVETVNAERAPVPRLARGVEAALVAGDFEAALANWEQLPEAVRAATGEWAGILRGRIAAAHAADAIANEAVAALAGGP